MHTHSTLTNLDEEESATSGNDCTIKEGFFECEYCSFKIEISYPDEDDSALFVKHFKEKHIDILQGNEIILQYLTDSTRKSSGMEVSNNFEKEFPDLETAANVKGKKVEKKQNPKTSSPNENKNLVNVRYPGGEMNLEHHRFPEFFSGGRKKLLYVIVSAYVSSFLSQKEQILCIMKELALTEQDYCESLETVNLYGKYISTLSENKKRLLDLRNDNREFDEKCKEFESNECMLRLPTLLSMPEKRFKYYFSICKRIEKICGQQECGGINRECMHGLSIIVFKIRKRCITSNLK
ncbi:Hypothetical predicted protein [Mytilus galloprovincialis]|uniref:DH domain-containing protein n=2 Tax=Mytilus galloprovincialis TaxID=29158 RepID=A0A8B6CNT9_MYTGA|nr:Hypothetical predicted protein [Mytilus galloprovincialis]